MTRATLTATDAPEIAPNARQLVIDCPHGTTTLTIMPARDPAAMQVHEAACVRLALLRHYSAEQCRCTKRLRKRYGLVGA